MAKKPSIPDALDKRFAASVKENLEIITGRRPGVGKLEALAAEAGQADIINKVNALLDRLQDESTPAVSPIVQAVVTPRRNVLLNGNLNLWQGGSPSIPGVTSTIHSADMTRFTIGNSGTWTVERSTEVPTVAQAGRKLNFSIHAIVTTADAVVNATDECMIRQQVEGYDYAPLYQQPQSVAFWVRGNKPGVYGLNLRNDANDRTYIQTITIDQANVWEHKVVQIKTAPVGGTWDFNNGTGIQVALSLVAGSSVFGVNGQWNDGNFRTTADQVNLADAVGNEIFIADVRLVPGLDPSTIIVPSIAEQIAHLRRYFEKSYAIDVAPGVITGDGNVSFICAVASHREPIPFRVEKRIIPAVTGFNPVTGASGTWNDHNAGNVARTFTVTLPGTTGFEALLTSCVAGNGVRGHWISDSRLL